VGVVKGGGRGVWVRVGEQLDGDLANGLPDISDDEGGRGGTDIRVRDLLIYLFSPKPRWREALITPPARVFIGRGEIWARVRERGSSPKLR